MLITWNYENNQWVVKFLINNEGEVPRVVKYVFQKENVEVVQELYRIKCWVSIKNESEKMSQNGNSFVIQISFHHNAFLSLKVYSYLWIINEVNTQNRIEVEMIL